MPAWLADLPDIRGDGISFAYEIAGASHYQKILETIVGGKREESVYFRAIAILSLEPENPDDPYAIAVRVAGETIGYIKKSDTDLFHKSFEKFGVASDVQCKAKIVGGWDRGGDTGSFGVRLDIDFPIEIRGTGIAKPIRRDKRFNKIGRLENVCPNCGVALAKRPGSKTRCQHCGGFIFVRTRPFDRQRVLLTEAEVNIVEAEWTQYHYPELRPPSSQQ
jgi:DNA-directed RNA polymerase subunit RPC12/RpoP